MNSWFWQRAAPTPNDLSDEDIALSRQLIGINVRAMRTNPSAGLERYISVIAESAMIQVELTAQMRDEIRGLREDLANYQNRKVKA